MAMTEADSIPRRAVLRTAAASALTVAIGSGADGPSEKKVEAKAEDVGSIEAIVSAVYDVISGPKGQPRDWGRMRSLFAPGARLIPCLPKGDDGRVAIRMMSLEDYISRSGPILEQRGFVERQVACRIDRFGHMAQVFSTYETRSDGKEAIAGRGINMMHLLWDEKRWWVVTIMWDAESPAQPIPADYDAKR
jgi:hypothetical protein